MPEMPAIEPSRTCVICVSTICAEAPGYLVETETMGSSTLGYSRTVSRV